MEQQGQQLKMEVRYATQTNTAFEIAIQFCERYSPYVNSLEPLSINNNFQFFTCNSSAHSLKTLYIFFIATTGYGDPPESMREVWKKLLSKNFNNNSGSDKNPLQNMWFAVYGLGDRSYGDNYNMTARKFRQRLLMLGGHQIFQIGLGDEQDRGGNHQQFRTFFIPKTQNFISVNSFLPYSGTSDPEYFKQYKYRIRKIQQEQLKRFYLRGSSLISEQHGRRLYWIIMEYSSSEEIKIGDTVSLFPENSQENVQKMYNYFTEYNLNDIGFVQQQLKWYLRCVANLVNNVNFSFFSNIPNRKRLYECINLQDKKQEKMHQIHELLKNKLIELEEDFNEYYNYITKYRRNVCEVIKDFDLRIPLSEFMRRAGVIIHRKYSIAKITRNQQKGPENSYELGLLIKEERNQLAGNRVVQGLCSNDLIKTSNKPNSYRFGKIINTGEFQYDCNQMTPLATISLGTGIAPFLSILFTYQEMLDNKRVSSEQLKQKILMFHSYRYYGQLPFREMLEQLSEKNILRQTITYTRQSNTPSQPKERIQEKVKSRIQKHIEEQNALAEISEILKGNGKLMICGNKQFIQYIFTILKKNLNLDIGQLRKKKFICVENW